MTLDLGLGALRSQYRSGALTPVDVAASVREQIAERGDDGVWISVSDDLMLAAGRLNARDRSRLPLWGVPFAVKDNIDVAAVPTTAACPAFAYTPDRSAPTVQRLIDAGALFVGKTNLDQFATGLSGVRSPYGIPRSAVDPELISGGSSSGSAVAVAAGQVSFALATDTAGSGRVPAALNQVVGLKPSVGLLSSRGVVPACRSLDCVSIMALSVADAVRVHHQTARFDPTDPWSRRLAHPSATVAGVELDGLRLGVPAQISGWGQRGESDAWHAACAALQAAGVQLIEVDFAPFLEAGTLLYSGPWLAERAAGLASFIATHPDEVHGVVREILARADSMTAADVWAGLHRIAELRAVCRRDLATLDALLTPTITAAHTVEQMLADPIGLNTVLGRFTSFTNLLRLCAVSVPTAQTPTASPFAVSIQGEAGADDRVASIAAAVERVVRPRPAVQVAVVGAHLAGMPLHHQIMARHGVLVRRTTTAPSYRLFALPGGPPPRPSLVETSAGGVPIEVEVYSIPSDEVGEFLASVAWPLAIGTVRLADGSSVHGFVGQDAGTVDAIDISHHGGWRRYLASAT